MTVQVGDVAPDFLLPATTGGELGLSSLYPMAPVVIAFYPRDDTPG